MKPSGRAVQKEKIVRKTASDDNVRISISAYLGQSSRSGEHGKGAATAPPQRYCRPTNDGDGQTDRRTRASSITGASRGLGLNGRIGPARPRPQPGSAPARSGLAAWSAIATDNSVNKRVHWLLTKFLTRTHKHIDTVTFKLCEVRFALLRDF